MHSRDSLEELLVDPKRKLIVMSDVNRWVDDRMADGVTGRFWVRVEYDNGEWFVLGVCQWV